MDSKPHLCLWNLPQSCFDPTFVKTAPNLVKPAALCALSRGGRSPRNELGRAGVERLSRRSAYKLRNAQNHARSGVFDPFGVLVRPPGALRAPGGQADASGSSTAYGRKRAPFFVGDFREASLGTVYIGAQSVGVFVQTPAPLAMHTLKHAQQGKAQQTSWRDTGAPRSRESGGPMCSVG